MTTRATIARRVGLLIDKIRPRHSLAARIERLEPWARAAFERHQTRTLAWIEQREVEPGGAYAAMLDGDDPPIMPRMIRDALFDPMPVIPELATVSQASDIYNRAIARNLQ